MRKTQTMTPSERDLLNRFLSFYRDLDSGERIPSTMAQLHFVSVMQGLGTPTTEHERAYLKYKTGTPVVPVEPILEAHHEKRSDSVKAQREPLPVKPRGTPEPENGSQVTYEAHFRRIKSGWRCTKCLRQFRIGVHPVDEALRQHRAHCKGEASFQIVEEREETVTSRRPEVEKQNPSVDIPEYEEGAPRGNWFTREDYKKLRRNQFSDVKKRSRGA